MLKGTEKFFEIEDKNSAYDFLLKNLSSVGVKKIEYLEANRVLHFDKGKDEDGVSQGGCLYTLSDDNTLIDIVNKVSMSFAKEENMKEADENLIKEYKRRIVLSAEIITKVYKEMCDGANPRSACINAGLAPVTYHRYKKRYEEIKDIEDVSILDENDQKIIILFQKIEEGFLKAVNRNEAIIQLAGKESWQASAWFLERRMPELYAMKKEVKQETTETKKITTTDELKQLLGDCKELEDILNGTEDNTEGKNE